MDDQELGETIEAQVQEWSSNSNECFTIDFVKGDGSNVASFQPEFTYPMFGEQESIFGYQDLSINLRFAAHNLRPFLQVGYGKKFKEIGGVRPSDIHEAFREFLPAEAFSSQTSSKEALKDAKAAEFKPPGKRISEYTRDGDKFEIWCATLADPSARKLLENIQALVPMLIEGGSILQLEQDWTTQRWKIFLLYQVDAQPKSDSTYSPYSLVGYGTSYRISTFPDRQKPLKTDLDLFLPSSQSLDSFLPPPDSTVPNDLVPTNTPGNTQSPLDLPCRERLSQFLILPPFQGSGHGQQLYTSMYTYLTSPPNVREFTVEDPNEAFDDLRDMCDLLNLRANNATFAALRINTDIPSAKLHKETQLPVDLIVPLAAREQILAETKITQRQFDRLVEMHTLSFVPVSHRSRSRITRKDKATNAHDRTYYFWRLYVKQRLYIFNRDQLAQMEREERVEKLESALDSVLEAYGEMLEKVEERERGEEGAGGEASERASEGRTQRPRKRKVVEEAEDEDEDSGEEDEGEETEPPTNGVKKARIA